ncbi:MAG: TRAP transporter substrate-binding protein [Desulfobacterales bacterium]|nr:MAG: TRAP transporter substrate-binding protein [Desulfobacterales bacterium]
MFWLVGACVLTLVPGGVLSVQAQTTKLTYSNFFPPTHIQSKLAEAWCQEVEKRTEGRVVVEYFPGETLTKATQVYDGVVTGLSDLGLALFAYTRGRFPVMAAVDLPLGYTSGKVATQVVNAVYKKFQPKELSDTQVMYLHAHGPGLLNTKSKPVRKLEDLKGLKLRGHGTSALIVKALGATPVPMPMPELYQSLQKGVVEGALYPLEVNKGWKMGEVTKYTTASYSVAYTSAFFVVMNKEKWNAFPDDIKQIIEQINAEWSVKHGEAWDSSDLEGFQYSLSLGHDIYGLGKDEAERWKQAVVPVIDEYIQDMKKKGFNGKEIVDFTVETLNQLQK